MITEEPKYFFYPQNPLRQSLPDDGSAKGSMYFHPSDVQAVFSDNEVSSRVIEYMFSRFLRHFYADVGRTLESTETKPPVVLYVSSEVEHLLRASVHQSVEGRVVFRDFSKSPEALHRQIVERLFQTGGREFWWDKDTHPIMQRQLNDEEKIYLGEDGTQRQLVTNLCDVDYVFGWIAGLGHFRSFIMANPGNIGANAKGIPGCTCAGLAPFALVLGDSLVPAGNASELSKDQVSLRVLFPLVRQACMAWNYRAGLLGAGEGCVQHIDYTDDGLVQAIVHQNIIGLKCHRQGPNMCAFQASLHCQAGLERILNDYRRGLQKDQRWPAGPRIGTVGQAKEKAKDYRKAIGHELRAIMDGI